MNTSEFVGKLSEFHQIATSRVSGIGAEQYYDPVTSRQDFENMTAAQIVDAAIEEALDLSNYAAMMYMRLQDVKEAVRDKEPMRVTVFTNDDGEWVDVEQDGKNIWENHSVPDFVWVSLLRDAGAVVDVVRGRGRG